MKINFRKSKIVPEKYIPYLSFVFLIILSFFLYHHNLTAFFTSDDFDWIAASKDRQPFTFFLTNSVGEIGGGNYGPIVNFVYYLSYKIGALNPLPYHLFSLFFHLGNIVLIYFTAKYFFTKKVALLAALLFTVYFNNSEVVSWVAAVPHLSATFFYLLAILLWLKFLDQQKKVFFIGSLIFFSLALLSKEIALSLPLVLIILYILEVKRGKIKFSLVELASYFLFYLLILVFYLYLRYYTTDLSFGYYAKTSFNVEGIYFKNIISYLVSLFLTNDLRLKVNVLALKYLWISFLLALAGIIALGAWLRKYLKFYLLGLALTFSSLVIYLPLLTRPLNNEGERYLYLPSIIFFIFWAFLLVRGAKKYPRLLVGLIIIITIASAYILYEKNKVWRLGGEIAQGIIEDFPRQVDLEKDNEGVVFLYLPDNLAGTQIFRNTIREAINLYYPHYDLDAVVLPVYIVLEPENWNKHLFNWQNKNNGLLGRTVNQEKIITGFDRRESEELIFELWGYDYNLFITDTIYVRIKEDFQQTIQKKQIYFLYFDEGGLKSLDKSLLNLVLS